MGHCALILLHSNHAYELYLTEPFRKYLFDAGNQCNEDIGHVIIADIDHKSNVYAQYTIDFAWLCKTGKKIYYMTESGPNEKRIKRESACHPKYVLLRI